MDTKHVAIVGCGLIGISWAALMVAHGVNVVVWDPDPARREGLSEAVQAPLAQLAELGPLATPLGQIRVAQTLEAAVQGAWLIQENAPEKLILKQQLYAQIEGVCGGDVVISSSTSSLVYSDLCQAMRHPERLITAHPFNPPHLMPLVEIFGVDEKITRAAEAFYQRLGRYTVRLRRDAVGHIANRLASALWREAVNIVAEGIADVDQVDAALVHGPGLRWATVGAHMAYHLGGGEGGMAQYLAHLGPSQERRWETLGTPRLTPDLCEKLVAGIEVEAAGRSVTDLAAKRDAELIATLKARRAL